MGSDLQNTGQSHSFDEHLKWSHGQYEHFAPSGFPYNHNEIVVWYKSVDFQFSGKQSDTRRTGKHVGIAVRSEANSTSTQKGGLQAQAGE